MRSGRTVKMSNKTVISTNLINGKPLVIVEDIISKLTHVSQKTSDKHYEENLIPWKNYLESMKSPYIERQHDLTILKFGSYKKLFHKLLSWKGEITASGCSCEVIAAYNALVFLENAHKNENSFPKLLNYFEKRNTILKGYFGTSIVGLIKYFNQGEYEDTYLYGRKINEEALTQIQENYSVYIFMSYNNSENIVDMIHTMCITRSEEGFFIHNSYGKPIFYNSLYEAVVKYNEYGESHSRPIAVIGIRSRK